MMMQSSSDAAIIFGGTGFIGEALASYILSRKLFKKVYLVDIEPLSNKPEYRAKRIIENDKIRVILGDVRESLDWLEVPERVGLIANLAAIHREPGHEDIEYYETNIYGAENVCKWAEQNRCENIIFTSSIAPYGTDRGQKTELTLPVPVTAYGGSKFTAEKIHMIWQASDVTKRRLLIARPGVVFGPGESGNVTRLIKAVSRGYFIYTGNRRTRKAGIYVKELCHAIFWLLGRSAHSRQKVVISNMTMNPSPSISDYVTEICRVKGVKRFTPSVPYILLFLLAHAINFGLNCLAVKHPFSPVRIKKLISSNDISPSLLINLDYDYQYSLHEALQDWKRDCPEEWT